MLCIGDQVIPCEDFDARYLLIQAFCLIVIKFIRFGGHLLSPRRLSQHTKSNLLWVEGCIFVQILDFLHLLRKPCQPLLWLGRLTISSDLLP